MYMYDIVLVSERNKDIQNFINTCMTSKASKLPNDIYFAVNK